ncbi:ultraviolet-B receptor UVR8-like [Hibiscus syriacus]|uniref:Ultraviolet-B receptor UVR8-like n=1 Tax=Hibiscus syriacus TaxID=106335 RepID=A0A6A3CZD0_HIBSY|nr:ultraviolet-B receptor UVR8-like [Hibiscus syriacus]
MEIGTSRTPDTRHPSYLLQRNVFFEGFVSVHGERPSSEYAKLRKESLESEFGHIVGTRLKKCLCCLSIWDINKRASKDQIPPFPTHVAIKSIENELGTPISEIFADISPEPIAAASIGQVYKAHLLSGELVAVKVQRPGMSLLLTLDALLFHMIGGQLKRFAKARKDLLVAVNEVVLIFAIEVRHMFDEIDYILEARNAERFASLYGDCPIYCPLRQLLEVGFFHADPHPGNLFATSSGSLAYLDFEMMGDIPHHYRVGLIQVLVHFVNRDSLGLANDFLSLGFIPEGVDIQSVADTLQMSFDKGTRQSQDFQIIMNQLYDVMYDFNFSLPPGYALVVRALGSLEGTAKVLDPDLKVVESAYPFVIGRLLADPNPDMRKFLRELLICNNGSIRWNRLERLVAAISEQASESSEEPPKSEDKGLHPLGWKSFDMRAVVAATEDLMHFILSEKGQLVRVFLLRDIIRAADIFLQDEDHAILTRVVNGFGSLRAAVKLAPEVWTPMFIRIALNPQTHSFLQT